MRRLLLALTMCVLATGCRHKQPQFVSVALPPLVPVAVDKTPGNGTGPLVQQVPAPAVPTTDVKLPKKAKKPKKKPAVPATVTGPAVGAVQVAGAGVPAPASSVVGALSAGGDGSPEKHKQASDLLSTLEKRLGSLSAGVADTQKEQLTRVRYFWGQAKAALIAGDADGAITLATKARVLLDDVVQ